MPSSQAIVVPDHATNPGGIKAWTVDQEMIPEERKEWWPMMIDVLRINPLPALRELPFGRYAP